MSNFKLNKIYSPPNRLPAANIVFVHGLGGTFKNCWSVTNSTKDEVWPLWLTKKFPSISVWGLEYPTSKTKFWWNSTDLSLLTVSDSLAELLRAKKIGKQPTIFVCHSLGGVILKSILRKCENSPIKTKKAIFDNCIAVVFFATPHAGSSLATLLSNFLGISSKQVNEITKNNESLEDLSDWYKNSANSSKIKTHSFKEKRKTNGALVVDGASANPGVSDCVCIPVDANHIDICKFDNEDHFAFLSISNFLEEIFSNMSLDVSSETTIDDLEYYINTLQGDRLSLSEKLTDGGRTAEIEVALREKERIAKHIQRGTISQSARHKYRQFLSEILTLFRLHISPLVREGANEIEVNNAIQLKLLDPLSNKFESNELFEIANIHSAIYYLTGNCHIDWTRTDV